ncbi:hypothetical protein [Gordonia sp. CPCC 205333]|uniref:hypothetical protein n=1 Tax=Gordonia sp. CPCC 205333 TaxID=3140790 RepID=UPI003AF3FE75
MTLARLPAQRIPATLGLLSYARVPTNLPASGAGTLAPATAFPTTAEATTTYSTVGSVRHTVRSVTHQVFFYSPVDPLPTAGSIPLPHPPRFPESAWSTSPHHHLVTDLGSQLLV